MPRKGLSCTAGARCLFEDVVVLRDRSAVVPLFEDGAVLAARGSARFCQSGAIRTRFAGRPVCARTAGLRTAPGEESFTKT